MEYKRLTTTIGYVNNRAIGKLAEGYLKGVNVSNVLNRLAAYEDSGLSPKQVQEFAEAQADGRLVVLPCKVEDTVYVVGNCENIYMYHDNDYLNGTGAVECPFENSCDFEDCDDSHRRIFETTCRGFMIEDGCKDGFHTFIEGINVPYSDECWGKTVFLTREAAGKALEGGARDEPT